MFMTSRYQEKIKKPQSTIVHYSTRHNAFITWEECIASFSGYELVFPTYFKYLCMTVSPREVEKT